MFETSTEFNHVSRHVPECFLGQVMLTSFRSTFCFFSQRPGSETKSCHKLLNWMQKCWQFQPTRSCTVYISHHGYYIHKKDPAPI